MLVSKHKEVIPVPEIRSLEDFMANPPEGMEWVDNQLVEKTGMTLKKKSESRSQQSFSGGIGDPSGDFRPPNFQFGGGLKPVYSSALRVTLLRR
ncbi:MAG: hypothetical protein KME30_09705 [Iphinoe sp. HA4291-MV1]|jgi:hypothetical protein|nr:hypothetical protein [Iphinoe sp. HA4291-MV1]